MANFSTKPRTLRINWGNPLTRGLVFSQPIISPNPNVDELVSKTRTAITNPIANNYTMTAGGLMITADGAASSGQYIATPLLSTGRSTKKQTHCFFTVRVGDGLGSTTNSYFRESDLTNAGFNVTDNSAVSSLIVASAAWSTTNGNWRFPLPSNGILYFYVVTYDATDVANVPNVYRNGVKQTPTLSTQPVGTLTHYDSHLVTMNIYQSGNIGTRTLNGHINNVCKWNRVLTETEILRLTTNPWQIYQFPQPTYAYSAGGGGGSTTHPSGYLDAMGGYY